MDENQKNDRKGISTIPIPDACYYGGSWKFEPTETKLTILSDFYWFRGKAVHVAGVGRRPKNLKEWGICIWNADVFFGRFPLFKFLVGCNILVWIILSILI